MEDELKFLTQKLWRAIVDVNMHDLAEIMDQQCTIVHTGVTADVEMEMQYYSSGVLNVLNVEIIEQKVNMHDTTAIVMDEIFYTIEINDIETTYHYNVSSVFVKENTWKLMHMSYTPLMY